MKISLAAISGIALAALVQTASAEAWSSRFQAGEPGDRYEAQELSLDLAGILATRDRKDFSGDTTEGVGVGVNYFLSRNLGIGADTYIDDWDFPKHLDASVLARFPIQQSGFAPYAFGGAGRQFEDVAQWEAHIGGGAEYRWNRLTGAFIDVREVFTDKSPDFTLWRLGLRIRFK